jgi:hypothetical protein
VALTVPFTIFVTPKRRSTDFGEVDWAPLPSGPIEVCYLLSDPEPIMSENSWRYTQDGKLYARRGVDLKDGDMVQIPGQGDFGIIGNAQLDFNHPMTGYDYGWVRFTIRRGG